MPDWVSVPDIPCRYPVNLAGVPDGPCRGWENGPGTLHRRIPYPANLAGVPDDPCRGWENGSGTLHRRIRYPVNWAGVPDALIFFCLLFFHQGKKRRKESRGAAPYVGAYCIRPTDDPRGSNDRIRMPVFIPFRKQTQAGGYPLSSLTDHLRGVCNTPLQPTGRKDRSYLYI